VENINNAKEIDDSTVTKRSKIMYTRKIKFNQN